MIQTRSEKFSTKHKIKITELKQTTREQDESKTMQKMNQKLGERLNTKRYRKVIQIKEKNTQHRDEQKIRLEIRLAGCHEMKWKQWKFEPKITTF